MADFDADKLGKRLEQLNREQLAALEQLSDRVLREIEAHRSGPKRADGSSDSLADGLRGQRSSRKHGTVE